MRYEKKPKAIKTPQHKRNIERTVLNSLPKKKLFIPPNDGLDDGFFGAFLVFFVELFF
jgi:hypothetical protein